MVSPKLKTGYYNIHPDVSINYQMNRFSDGSEQMLNEMREVAPRIGNYADYTREFLALSERHTRKTACYMLHVICVRPNSLCFPTMAGKIQAGFVSYNG